MVIDREVHSSYVASAGPGPKPICISVRLG